MAIRNDIITIDWDVSPRLIWIDISETEVTVKDVYDTCRYYEALTENMDNPPITDAGGGEPLGGGVTVGLTVSLYDAQYAFAARPGPEWVICNMTGGNIVAFTDYTQTETLYPRYPTSFVSADRTASSSATSQNAEDIQYGSFGDVVSVDVDNNTGRAIPGTGYPAGNKEYPSNNIADAIIIATTKGFDTISVIGNITLDADALLSGFTITGQNANKSTITVLDAADTFECEFFECTLTGILDGGSIVRDGIVHDVSYVNGVVNNCILSGTITLGGSTTAHFLNCFSGTPGTSTPTIDMGGTGCSLAMRGYNGGIKLVNKIGTDAVSIDLSSGQIVLDVTVTQGELVLRGIGKLTDNTIPQVGLDIYSDDLINKENISDAVWQKTSGIQRLIESQKRLPSYGEMVYVDYSTGDNLNDGLTPETPVADFMYAHDNIVIDGRGDIIFILNSHESTDIDEQWSITKSHISIRGSGWHTVLYPSATTGPSINIAASEVSLENFQVRTSEIDGGTGDQYCVNYESGSDLCISRNMKIKRGIDGGCNVNFSDGVEFHDSIFEHFAGKSCIDVRGDSHEMVVNNNFIYDCSYGVSFHDDVHENWLKNNLFHDMAYGIHIVDITVGHTYIDRNNVFGNLGGRVLDVGGSGIIDFTQQDADQTSDAVLSAPLIDHQIPGTLGDATIRSYYNNMVVFDADNGVVGIEYPTGTHSQPVNNLDDAFTIMENLAIGTLDIHTDIILTSAYHINNMHISSESAGNIEVVLVPGVSTTNMTFSYVNISGTFNGRTNLQYCEVNDVVDFEGSMVHCALAGSIEFIDRNRKIYIYQCQASGIDLNVPTLDVNGCKVTIVDYTGWLEISNKNADNVLGISSSAGIFYVDAGCIAGNIVFAGTGKLASDLSGVGCVVNDDNLINNDSVKEAVWSYERTP